MNKRTPSFLCLLMISTPSFSQEHEHRHHLHQPRPIRSRPVTPELHITIDVPDRPQHENRIEQSPRSPAELRKYKAKLVAATAIITAIISGGVTLYIALRNCK